MHDMDFEYIRKRLLDEGYADNAVTDETVRRLQALTGKPAELLREWLSKGTVPSFAPIHGVDSKFLQDRLKMKAPALAIAYAMLEAQPEENAEYFQKLADNIIKFYPRVKK